MYLKTIIATVLACHFWLLSLRHTESDYNIPTEAIILDVYFYELKGILYFDNENNIKGVAAEMLKQFKYYTKNNDNIDIKFNFIHYKNWLDFVNALNTKTKLDNFIAIGDIPWTKENSVIYKMSPPFFSSPITLVSNNSPQNDKQFEYLIAENDLTGLVLSNSIYNDYLSLIKNKYNSAFKTEFRSSKKEIFSEVINNENLFTLMFYFEFEFYQRQNQPIKNHTIALLASSNLKLGIISAKGSKWGTLSSNFVNVYTKSNYYKKSIVNNLGPQFLSFVK